MQKLTVELVARIMEMAPSLVGFEWCPFSQRAVLQFRGGTEKCTLTLAGIHLLTARQSQFGSKGYIPINETNHEDWFVEYLAVHTAGSFLQNYLDGNLGFDSSIVLYSTNGARRGTADFRLPVHLSMVTGGGHLDVICESMNLTDT